MHLAHLYARDLGVKVGYPVFTPHFFPVTDEKYIVLHNGKKVPAKTYSYWEDVVRIIKPELEKRGIQIHQIGPEEEENIKGIDKRVLTKSLKQSAFIIDKSLMIAGIDSVPIHIASALDKNSVSIYAHTYVNTCDPLWNRNSKAITIESNRGGKKPSFSLEEHPKTIDMIMPETIADAIFSQLGITGVKTPKTIFIGHKYNLECLDFVCPVNGQMSQIPSLPSNVVYRMDISHQEHLFAATIAHQQGEAAVKTSKPINIEVLKRYKSKIAQFIYQCDKFDKNFIKQLMSIGMDFTLVCTSPKFLKEQRLDFFEHDIHYFNEDEFKEENAKKIKDKITSGKINFVTKKTYLYGTKKVLNLMDLYKACNKKTDKKDFFVDVDHMLIHN